MHTTEIHIPAWFEPPGVSGGFYRAIKVLNKFIIQPDVSKIFLLVSENPFGKTLLVFAPSNVLR